MKLSTRSIGRPATAGLAAAMMLGALAVSAQPAQRDQVPWEQMQQHSFAVADGGTLRVDLRDADVAIGNATGGGAEVTISLRSNDMEWARDRFERTNYRARLDGDTVIIDSDEEPRNSWVSGNWMSVNVEVRVPSRFNLHVVTQDGDVEAASFEGDARLRSQDGDIRVESLGGGSIDLQTQDGDVRAARLEGTEVILRSQDGDIEVDTVRGMLAAHTQDGDIHIGAAESSEIELDTSDGDIHVGIAGASRMRLDTNDGDISIEAPSSLRAEIDLRGEDVSVRGIGSLNGEVSRGRARGTVNGGGETITARSGDGNVRLIGRN